MLFFVWMGRDGTWEHLNRSRASFVVWKSDAVNTLIYSISSESQKAPHCRIQFARNLVDARVRLLIARSGALMRGDYIISMDLDNCHI